MKQPNYSINLVPLSIGITYKPTRVHSFTGEKAIPEFIAHNQANILLMLGSKNYAVGEPSYLKVAIGVNWLRAFNYKYLAGLGFDVFYSAQVGPRNETKSTFSNSIPLAIIPPREWAINKHLYVPVAIGIYLKRNEDNDERNGFYDRV